MWLRLYRRRKIIGGDDRIRTDDKGFADPRLNHLATSPLYHPLMERKMRFGLMTLSLARRCSTAEPLPPLLDF